MVTPSAAIQKPPTSFFTTAKELVKSNPLYLIALPVIALLAQLGYDWATKKKADGEESLAQKARKIISPVLTIGTTAAVFYASGKALSIGLQYGKQASSKGLATLTQSAKEHQIPELAATGLTGLKNGSLWIGSKATEGFKAVQKGISPRFDFTALRQLGLPQSE